MVYPDKPFFQYYILVFYRKLVKLDLHICEVSRVWQWQNWTPPSLSRGGLCVQGVQVWKEERRNNGCVNESVPLVHHGSFHSTCRWSIKLLDLKSLSSTRKYLRQGQAVVAAELEEVICCLSSCCGELLVHHQFGLGFNGLVNQTGTPWFTADCARTS